MRKSIISTTYVLLLSIMCTPAFASVIYSYTGSPYEVSQAPYDNTMSINVTVELESALGNNFSHKYVTPLSFSISDGIHIITDSNATDSGFTFATNSTGEITIWGSSAKILSPMLSVGDTELVITTSFIDSLFEAAFLTTCIGSISASCDITTGASAFVYTPGSWTVSAVPIPSTVWLFGSGFIGLIGVARRNKS